MNGSIGISLKRCLQHYIPRHRSTTSELYDHRFNSIDVSDPFKHLSAVELFDKPRKHMFRSKFKIPQFHHQVLYKPYHTTLLKSSFTLLSLPQET
uniref:Uncharacterized protein n=1 Tax=Lactuca sativa TaxID=4236 RepID=A0A9R1ULP7_LACSA|nr:hypothetical protein LSAT_V11C800395530 [Lactuca sativa]